MMHYPKSEAEWLALRHVNVSSTESAGLFGLSPYHTAYELAVVKTMKEPTSWEQNERIKWGLRLQEAIAKAMSDEYGVKVRRVTGYAVRADLRLGASFDYEIVGIRQNEDGSEVQVEDNILQQMYRDLGPGILEIKNVDAYVFRKEWKPDPESEEIEAPPHIEIQVQHQLAAVETRAWSAIGVLIGGNRLMLVVREKDEEFIAQLLAKVGKFWENLDKGIMPPVVLPADIDIIRRIFLNCAPGKLFDGNSNEELQGLCASYVMEQQEAKAHEEMRKTLGAKILMMIGDSESGVCDGYKIQANTVGETTIPAYTRKAFRVCKVTEMAVKGSPRKGKVHAEKK